MNQTELREIKSNIQPQASDSVQSYSTGINPLDGRGAINNTKRDFVDRIVVGNAVITSGGFVS